MLAHHSSQGDAFGRLEGSFPPKYLSLEQVQLLHNKYPISTRKAFKAHKLHIVTSPAATAYRPPTSTSSRLKKTKSIRPKQEQPPSPAMSGYSSQYSSSDQGNYSYPTYQPGVPQYTPSQINTYLAQYQQYPPQPYQVIPEYYAQQQQPVGTGYLQPQVQYDTSGWETTDENSGGTASQGQNRTWTCDIPTCTSSAHFTRLADLQRHQSTVHAVRAPDFPCHVARCNRVGEKGFTRRDHLVEHLRNFHHIDIPKRRPGERSAFPFGWPEGGVGGGRSAE
ncbi:C2H2 zinc finger domain-containing protein [Stemphylium lycopersici]|nr:C2H2 zinc finger domain-containing protein [Stemphylium lycopersici]